MDERQSNAFWSTIEIMNEASVLPHVIVIGSWAEYLYSFYFQSDFMPNIRTRDVDFLYPNVRRPSKPIHLEQKMREAGYVIVRDRLTEVVKMFKDDLLEIEFLTRQMGSSANMVMDIPGIGIRGQSLRDVNILARYPLSISVRKYFINVPEPAAYALQKLMINAHRVPQGKRAKDIESVRNVLPHIENSVRDLDMLRKVLKACTSKELNAIKAACSEYLLELPIR